MKKTYFAIVSVILVVVVVALSYFVSRGVTPRMSYNDFLKAVEMGEVVHVVVPPDKNTFQVVLGSEMEKRYEVSNPQTDNFIEYLLLNDIEVDYGQMDPVLMGLRAVAVLGIAGGVVWFVRKGGSNKIQMKDVNKKSGSAPDVTLNQVAGNVEAKAMVLDIIQFIKEPEKYTNVGAKMPKGLLFYGPPGTGKTLMAKAIAGEAEVPFYAMSGSDFVQMYVGVGASRIRSLFQKAKKNERAVIFIDEIDAIGKKRARSASASNDERDQTLNALLTEMSGFHENSGIVVIGATNRLDTLDEALLRPGRFDRQIEIGLPDVNSRKTILSLYADKKPLSDDVDLDGLAASTVCFSGAMLENLLNEAAINAANDDKCYIDKEHVDKAFYTVIAGAPKQDRSYITEEDRRVTAYHEAGHALVTALLLPDYYISKVTIIPSVKGAGGFNLSIPKDTFFQTEKQIRANVSMLLAGRASEELIFGMEEITTGASDDIQKASARVLEYVNKYGMDSELGLFSMNVMEDVHDAELVNKCRELIKELYESTKSLLSDNLTLLECITAELLEKESISGEDIKRIIAENRVTVS